MIDYIGSDKHDIFQGAINYKLNQENYQDKKLLSLNKLGKKKVKNLLHLKNLLKTSKNKILSLEYESKKYISVGY